MDERWREQSRKYRSFWKEQILSDNPDNIPDHVCDEIIRILDRSGKGNTKDSQAIAKVMIAQGAWRRLFNEFHANQKLGSLVHDVLVEENLDKQIVLIDHLYKVNEGHRNHLTGPNGNAICTLMAAYDPMRNLSIVSLNDRRAILEYCGIEIPFDWESASVGTRIVRSNQIIISGMLEYGYAVSARTTSVIFYSQPVKALWRGEHTVSQAEGSVKVMVPQDSQASTEDMPKTSDLESIRESIQIQALIANIGATMGYRIWLPKADRQKIFNVWKPDSRTLLNDLPLGYDPATMKTIAQIDVPWIHGRSIVRAFEVEHTTSIYSGLLRMSDLLALQPNINVKLHIVAPNERREKVLAEILRPTFSFLEGGALSRVCSYLSYESIRDIGEDKHLEHLSDQVLNDYETRADYDDVGY
jgi:hypothetical protein